MKKVFATGGGLFALLLVASSSLVQGAEQAGGTGAAAAEAEPLAISMRNSEFIPQAAVVQVNLSVTWTNDDEFAHDVTSVEEGLFESPRSMEGGATWTHNFTTPGVYDYFCTLHSTGAGNGMWGRIIVTPAPFLAVAGTGGAAHAFDPEEIGVKWLAHWVGIVSFVAVFATLLIYYFVLKYGESVHTTDHRDRKEK